MCSTHNVFSVNILVIRSPFDTKPNWRLWMSIERRNNANWWTQTELMPKKLVMVEKRRIATGTQPCQLLSALLQNHAYTTCTRSHIHTHTHTAWIDRKREIDMRLKLTRHMHPLREFAQESILRRIHLDYHFAMPFCRNGFSGRPIRTENVHSLARVCVFRWQQRTFYSAKRFFSAVFFFSVWYASIR